MKPMKVLHVIDSLGYGGAEHQLTLTVSALERQCFESSVCYLHPPSYLTDRINEQGIRVYGLGLPRGKGHWLRAVSQVRELGLSLGTDLIHTSLFESDLIGGLAGRLCGIPVMSTLCSIGDEPERLVDNPHTNAFKRSLTTKFWGLALRSLHSHYVAVSNAVKFSAMRSYGLPESKITVVYRALFDAWFSEDIAPRSEHLRHGLGIHRADPILLNIGRLVPQKGQRYLIEAMAMLARRLPRARLLIAGDGFLKPTLAELCDRIGIEKRVSFLGYRNDVKDLLAVSDIFVFPSLLEGFGNALIEAMAMGKPCVVSRIGPTEEVIDDNVSGLLVTPRDPNAIAEAIIRLTTHTAQARAMGEQAQIIARRRFSIKQIIGDLERVYEDVLGGGRVQRRPTGSATR